MKNPKIINALNNILTRCYDAEKGYKRASDNMNNVRLSNFFSRLADQRNRFGHEIKEEIKSFDGNVDKGGSFEGTLHREWMDFKALVSQDSDEEILSEVLRGEESSLKAYKDLMEMDNIPRSTYSMAEDQMHMLRASIATIELEEVMAS